MDYELELKNEQLENMITVYEKHIEELEEENKQLKAQVDFLKEQLAYLEINSQKDGRSTGLSLRG